MDQQQEKELVEMVQRKEDGAFDRLYDEYKNPAYRTAVFLTGNTADAQDVVQETFIAVCLNIGKLKETAAFRSWFYRILTHNASRISKKKNREILQEEISDAAFGKEYAVQEDISELLTKKEESMNLRKIIGQMDEKYRTVLTLYYFNEFSVGQIARVTGCLSGMVKSRLYYARKQLEQELLAAEGSRLGEKQGYR